MSGLQILNKSYTTLDHLKKILRSLPAKYRPKVTAIQEAKYLNTLSLEGLVRNLKSYEIELNGNESEKQVKTVALNSVRITEKSFQIKKHKETTHDEASDEESDDDELAFIVKRFQHFSWKKNIFSSKRDGFKGSSYGSKDQDGCYNCKNPDHFIAKCPDLQKDKRIKESFQKNNFRRKFKKSIMATWE